MAQPWRGVALSQKQFRGRYSTPVGESHAKLYPGSLNLTRRDAEPLAALLYQPMAALPYSYDETAMELNVGAKAQRTLTITAEHVNTYAELTGDYNPLHFDEIFTAKTRFRRLVAQGGLTTGLLHALVAMDLPGPGTVFLSQDWKFTAPVYIGDTITAQAEVLSVHESKPVTQLGLTVTRQSGETVLEGEAWCYTLSPEA